MEGKFEFEEERNADLMRNFRSLITRCRHIHMPDVYSQLVRLPARRFWVSEKRAAVVVGRMMRGDDLSDMRPRRAEMFREIYRRTMELRSRDGEDAASISRAVAEVVTGQAPSFYITENTAKAIICRLNRKARRKRDRT